VFGNSALWGLLEDDGFAAVQQDAVFDVAADGSGENAGFDVAAYLSKLFDAHGVIDAFDVLTNDWPFVEVGGDVVGGCANDFYTAGVGLVVGASAFEAR